MAATHITLPAFTEGHEEIRHYFGTRHQRAHRVLERAEAKRHARTGPWSTGRESLDAALPASVCGSRSIPCVVVSVHQVHGTDILVLDRPVRSQHSFTGAWDALVTNQPGILLTVRTADCVPVLIYDPDRHVVAAVHAGWRGAVAGIIPKTLAVMYRAFGSPARSLHVGIGPSIGPCCYEVDEPVLGPLRTGFPDWSSVIQETGGERARLDLGRLVGQQAQSVGVKAERIWTVRACTVCHPDLFYSYRRDGVVNGTMVSGIMVTHRLASNPRRPGRMSRHH